MALLGVVPKDRNPFGNEDVLKHRAAHRDTVMHRQVTLNKPSGQSPQRHTATVIAFRCNLANLAKCR